MPRPLAGFFVFGEGDIGLHLPQDIANGRWLEPLANVSVPVHGAQDLSLRPDTVSPGGDECVQAFRDPNKAAFAILVGLGKPQPQRRLAVEQAGHVFKLKPDEFGASAHGLIAHQEQDAVSQAPRAVILRRDHPIQIVFCKRLGLFLRAAQLPVHTLHGKRHVGVLGCVLQAPEAINGAQRIYPPADGGRLVRFGHGVNMRGNADRGGRQGMNALISAPLGELIEIVPIAADSIFGEGAVKLCK